jgi:carbamoyl-phosphate synthase small subunit
MVNKSAKISREIISKDRSEGSAFFKLQEAKLYLSDGTSYDGMAPEGQTSDIVGEVVFNTGMTGYVESLTDPSYTNQILVFTYPLIGNYGVQLGDAESEKIQVSGVVMSEIAQKGSHLQSEISLVEWLTSQNIPILSDVDTRELTKHLRVRGTMLGQISNKKVDYKKLNLTPKIVSISEPIEYNNGHPKSVILVDCGAKDNILQSLLALNVNVKRVPFDYDYTNEDYDGVLLSNGPGDPTDYKSTIEIAKKAIVKGKPIFGICLGNQILGLAAGGSTYKLPFGHRGHNQPCMDMDSEHCIITSQNHGYAIDEKTLPKGWNVWFRNLNDKSIEGIKHASKPFFSVQFHPEACPGPTDSSYLFEEFYKCL